MPLWDKVKQELDRAGRVAQEALDEGRIRLEALRARQMADKAAERLGYAVHRARAAGGSVEGEEIAALAEHEAEATRLDAELAVITRRTPRPADAAEGGVGAAASTEVAPTHAVDPREGVDVGGTSGASHRADGSVHTGDAGTGSPTGRGSGGAGDTGTAQGAPPQERTEWNREHL